jgi:hypothetical protein
MIRYWPRSLWMLMHSNPKPVDAILPATFLALIHEHSHIESERADESSHNSADKDWDGCC